MFEHFGTDRIFEFSEVNFTVASNVRVYVPNAPVVQKCTYQ